jgi:hypothetical protein
VNGSRKSAPIRGAAATSAEIQAEPQPNPNSAQQKANPPQQKPNDFSRRGLRFFNALERGRVAPARFSA